MTNNIPGLVSVIVPVYNVETFLEQCMQSIVSQTYPYLEVICVNDGSTDRSLQILDSFASRDPRVTVVTKENGGYGAACNFGLSHANGEWVSIIEPDDWIDTNMYQDMIEFASSFDTNIDIVKTPWIEVHNWNDQSLQYSEPSAMYHLISTSKKPFVLAEHSELIELHPSIWSALYRNSFLREFGIKFNEYPGAGWADNPFLIETLCHARSIVYLDECYYNYRFFLPGSTLNHQTDDDIALPFNRWIEMFDIINKIGITDSRIIASHYLRGVNYVMGGIYDDGWDTPLVQVKTKEVFNLMDPTVVLSHPKISSKNKKFFCEVRDINYSPKNRIGRLLYLLRESWHQIRLRGFRFFINSTFNHFRS